MHQDIFIKLVEAVEAEGGELAAETHFPTPFVYVHEDAHSHKIQVPVEGTGCGQDALLQIFYNDLFPDKEGHSTGKTAVRRSAVFCAIDDRMDLWPRYAKSIYGSEDEA